jgi:thiamine-triphosphatase
MSETFEVERNFALAEDERARLLEGAEFKGLKTISDVYFDTPAYALTLEDKWLRSRNGQYELKLPVDMTPGNAMDQYHEITDAWEIRETIGLPAEGTMADVLAKNGYERFCVCTTRRETYEKEGFTIVVDEIEYAAADWTYETCEIELLVDAPDKIADAGDRINAFAAANGLDLTRRPNGKVVEYLERERPEHYKALVAKGVTIRSAS